MMNLPLWKVRLQFGAQEFDELAKEMGKKQAYLVAAISAIGAG
jgi:hypothetical protein